MFYFNSYDNIPDLLVPYGINFLTGEACVYSMRLLCDYTETGAQLLENCFGMNAVRGNNHNCGHPDDPHVGSVMLFRKSMLDLLLFAILRTHFAVVMLEFKQCGVPYTTYYVCNNQAVLDNLVTQYERQHPDGNTHIMYGE